MRRLVCLLVFTCTAFQPATTAFADSRPTATTSSASGVTASQARVFGTVTSSDTTTYHFEWGTSTAYGQVAPAPDGSVPSGGGAHQMSHNLTGLNPGTTYHYRLVATNDHGTARGADQTFTTAGVAAAAPVTGTTGTTARPGAAAGPAGAVDATPATDDGTDPAGDTPAASGGAARPAFGKAVVGVVTTGTVLVRAPGKQDYTELHERALPVSTVVDATQGTFSLTSALDANGHTQRAAFWGGRFTVRQPAAGHGVVELRLVGVPTGCAPGTARAAAKRRPIQVWGQDHHGKFRTRGRFSAATVRGTKWLTTETCAGTRTTVAQGAVSVFDRVRHRTVLVRAGGSYLARRG